MSSQALEIVCFIFLFYFVSSLFTFTLIARNEQRKMLQINAIVAVVNIIGNLIFIPYFSFIGSAWVTLISQVLLMLITGYTVRHQMELKKIYLSAGYILFWGILGLCGSLALTSTGILPTGEGTTETLIRILGT